MEKIERIYDKEYYKYRQRIFQYKTKYSKEYPINDDVKEMLKIMSPKEAYYTLKIRGEYDKQK